MLRAHEISEGTDAMGIQAREYSGAADVHDPEDDDVVCIQTFEDSNHTPRTYRPGQWRNGWYVDQFRTWFLH